MSSKLQIKFFNLLMTNPFDLQTQHLREKNL